MSISPTDAQRSAPRSSSAAAHRNPRSHHGLSRPSAAAAHPRRRRAPASGSPPAAASEASPAVPGSVIDFGGSPLMPTEPVSGSGMPDMNRDSSDHNADTVSRRRTADCGGLSSQLMTDRYESNGKQSGNSDAQQSDHFFAGSSGLHVTVAQSAARRSQIGNANHLLNFNYVPISRPQPRNPPPRRQRKIKPYNKDLFLQANFKFVVLDTGDHQIESTDPDRMLQWEDIICVRYSTPFPVQCPICLDTPLCPQITSCGHIYCFPCILRYLLMGEEDHKGECWKKCPLCFMMISLKDLYTIYINIVKQFHVGDRVCFTLLSRAKDSLVPSLKNHQEANVMPANTVGNCDLFSKFIFTSDVELSVREAKSDLNNWLCKADSGQVDDLEKLPYVCAALEQLEERMKMWTEHRIFSGSPPIGSQGSLSKSKERDNLKAQSATSKFCSDADNTEVETWDSTIGTLHTGQKHDSTESSGKIIAESPSISPTASPQPHRSFKKELPLHSEDCGLQRNSQDRDSYTFYQAFDGQHLILHPLNMKCLLHHYGSYDLLPPRISGIILELETITQSEAMRRRYRYLSHFSLTTSFQLCEIDMSDVLPPGSLSPFVDEIKKREKQRKRLARKEQKETAKAEIAAAYVMPTQPERRYSSHEDAVFSLDDFEALGSGAPSTSPPKISERKLFSSVARLGFAAAHDSPPLRGEDSADSSGGMVATGETSSSQDGRAPVALSFANIISAAKNDESPSAHRVSGSAVGKKGKKPTRVLLSTAGGRRY